MSTRLFQMLLSRRSALGVIGAVGLAGCGGGSSDSSGSGSSSSSSSGGGSSSSSSSSGSSSASCTTTDEGEVGPYFADDSASGFDRSNIVSNIDGSDTQAGVALTLTVYVYDAENSCAAMEGVQVDIWHCNPYGIYSDISSEGTSADSYLRGYQLTDADGKVVFTTIIPGWYSGRTTHIHLRLRSSYDEASSTSDGSNTTQLFFPQTLIDTLATSVSPYDSEGSNPTTNATDRVYADQVFGTTLLSPSGSTADGYTASISLYLPITYKYSTEAPPAPSSPYTESSGTSSRRARCSISCRTSSTCSRRLARAGPWSGGVALSADAASSSSLAAPTNCTSCTSSCRSVSS
jgi:protocatechuate 3,4-dioxygenase beta subunit